MYQTIDDLKACASGINASVADFECSAFNGEYVTGDIDEAYLERLSLARSDSSKVQHELDLIGGSVTSSILEIHNQA